MSVNKKVFVAIALLISINAFLQNISKDTFGEGLTIAAEDSSFNLKFGFRFQTLYEGIKNLKIEEFSENLLIWRSRLKFERFVFEPSIKYKVELAISNRDHRSGHLLESGNTANVVLDAVLKWGFAKNWSVWFGQTKLPGNRERLISSQKLQFVDRSLVNSRFTLDRGKGIQFHHKSGNRFVFRQALSISIGEGRNIIT